MPRATKELLTAGICDRSGIAYQTTVSAAQIEMLARNPMPTICANRFMTLGFNAQPERRRAEDAEMRTGRPIPRPLQAAGSPLQTSWGLLLLLCLQQSQQEHAICVSVPVSNGPDDEENSEPKKHEALGPEQGKGQHPTSRNYVVLARHYVVDVPREFNDHKSRTEYSENASAHHKPPQARPLALLFSHSFDQLLLSGCELHKHTQSSCDYATAGSLIQLRDFPACSRAIHRLPMAAWLRASRPVR